MENAIRRRLWIQIIIIVLFAVLLTSFRLLWINHFNYGTDQPVVTNGTLDLRDWDFSDGRSVTLDGEWDFYPYELMENVPRDDRESSRMIDVPGDWSSVLNPDDPNPYGHGSYHLQLLVSAEKDNAFKIRVPSVRSSSALYVDGILVGESGQVGKNESDAKAFNAPYSSTSIYADESGVIDIVLQVANFEDPRSSGLVRSIKFGHDKNLEAETQLSITLQLIAGIIFFIHALFAVLFFVVGVRDRRLLYFALVILALSFINVSGGDEKVLSQYVTLDYTVSFKLSMYVMFLLSWALIHCVEPQLRTISKKIVPVFTILVSLVGIVIFFIPIEHLSRASNLSFGFVLLGAIITVIGLLHSRKEFQGSILVALSIVAIASQYIWWAYTMGTGLKVVYYPFDLIIAIICMATVWFKHYYNLHEETKVLAIRLQKTDKVKDQFLVNTSHELRNPLHSILNISQAVLEREQSSLGRESIQNLETVLSVSRRMSFMLNELLDITSLKEGSPKLHCQPISLQAITEGVIDMLGYMREGKPVQFENHMTADLPYVYGDENRVTQIVFNLIHNAVKYTPKGKVTIQAIVQNGFVHTSIIDTGIGMDRQTMNTIFEPYVQGDNATTMIEGGLGLGLNISKQLTELHGGRLYVESNLGKGSVFTFSLPVIQSSNEYDNKIIKQSVTVVRDDAALKNYDEQNDIAEEEIVEHAQSRPRIIVVDDDPVNLQVIKTILSAKLYEIQTALLAQDALSLLDNREWDLVIVDVMMPEMSGYELTRLIRERFSMSELPVLLLTARSSPNDIESGFLAGANDYVAKPVETVELRSRVNALIKIKQSTRELLRLESAWLQAQIQPHFLFNTLNSIIALSEIDINRMQALLEAFSKVLRGKFNKNMDELIPIEDELNVIKSYLYIEKERFDNRLHINWNVDEGLSLMIPPLSIQPLVENAINHGVMKRIEGGEINISVSDARTHAEISVNDNGVGISENILQQIKDKKPVGTSGVGLLNTNLRIQRLFGQGLQIESEVGRGTTVCFRVPYSENVEE